LPRYRGASPIQSSLINGDDKIGVTIMKMSEEMDEGDILDILEIPIDRHDTTEKMFKKFGQVSGKFLIKVLEKLEKNLITSRKQDDNLATYCQKMTKEMGQLDFSKSAETIFYLWK
jgi:methionyl-tRNA formyltransferase